MENKYLGEIVEWHRARTKEQSQTRDLNYEIEELGATRSSFKFSRALVNMAESFGVIAELKKRSPSKGDLNPELDVVQFAKDFEFGGAACLSVLTDEKFFGGCLEDLSQVKSEVGIPVLRKDFTVSSLDVCDAKRAGADAVLLIMAALDDEEASQYHLVAKKLGLDALFEAHTSTEINRVFDIVEGSNEVGALEGHLCILINQRDLSSFEEYPTRALELADMINNTSREAVTIAASAINSPKAARQLKAAGYNGILVGEYLMKSKTPIQALKELIA